MSVKVVFIGNPFGGDDGIGPFLYNELRDHPELKSFELMELGVIGIDLLSYVDDDDQLIIVDAVKSDDQYGQVIVLGEKDLSKNLSVVSQHDFGVEQTATILRAFKPKIKKIQFIGIKVKNLNEFSDKLSDEVMEKMSQIKEDVVNNIKKIVG